MMKAFLFSSLTLLSSCTKQRNNGWEAKSSKQSCVVIPNHEEEAGDDGDGDDGDGDGDDDDDDSSTDRTLRIKIT